MSKQPSTVARLTSDSVEAAFETNQHARQLFDAIAFRYDRLSQLLSFFQAGAWRRYLISRLNVGPEDTVLDICTGTAVVALEIARKSGATVIGLDLSGEMLRQAQNNVAQAGMTGRVSLHMGRAESLGLADASFDAVCFTWLLRYVDDPRATVGEIARVLKPGGTMVSLEFCVPDNLVVRNIWNAYTRVALRLATKAMSPGWRYVGDFLGPSITGFYRSHPLNEVRQMWVDSGFSDVQLKKLSWGGGVVMWGTKDQ